MTTLAFLWIFWCALHSFLISRQAHNLVDKHLGRSAGAYRILYVLFSIITLLPILWYQFSLPQHIILEPSIFSRLVQAALLVYGALMFYLGARVYNMHFFLGITQWLNAKNNRPTAPLPFHMDGVLAHVRHPWYSGGIAIIWGFGSITDVFLLTRLILTGYFIIGTVLEEKRLARELGEQYTIYQRRVPMLVPWKFSRTN